MNSRSWRINCGFLLLGLINNTPYCMVLGAAKNLANSFKGGQLGVITFADIGMGLVSNAVNTFCLTKVPHKYRVAANTFFMALGLIGVSIATHFNFMFLVFSIVFIGISSSFGESVLLGYIRNFNSEVVGSWASGTGFAGVVGTALYLLLEELNLSDQDIFLFSLPLVGIYALAFFVVLPSSNDQGKKVSINSTAEDTTLLIPHESNEPLVTASKTEVENDEPETGWTKVWSAWTVIWWPATQLMMVYFFEYVASTGAAEHIFAKDSPRNKSYVYPLLSLCYQLGVMFSRSSLQFFKIKKIHFLTVIQMCFCAVWLCNASLHFLSIYVGVPFMFAVGLIGGGMYVNTFYLLNTAEITESKREMCINLTTTFYQLGIIFSSFFTILMDSTWLKNK
eukprot:GCRY01002340.1.p1 GENE.GCRY01002340.1~~GCRY01002340.1.p1  ORF type:complete len:394 (-),score=16.02 GCRY01002340.1:89-1270(-)